MLAIALNMTLLYQELYHLYPKACEIIQSKMADTHRQHQCQHLNITHSDTKQKKFKRFMGKPAEKKKCYSEGPVKSCPKQTNTKAQRKYMYVS